MKFCRQLIIGIALLLIILTNAVASASSIKLAQTYFLHLCQTGKFSGAALIAINGKIKFEKACGLANRDFQIPNTIETKFNLGSVGKLFTIVSIAQLIENKKLALNTNANSVIPSWLPMDNVKSITIEQLLTHSSGLGNFMDDRRWKLGADSGLYDSTDDYKPLIKAEKLLFRPGESQFYSNSAYLVLGKIIENLSHESYIRYIDHNILSTAKMHNTGIYPLDGIVRNRSIGYYYTCKNNICEWKNNNYQAPFIGTSAGGAYSTIGDLFKFSQALYSHKLLDQEITKEILSSSIVKPSKNIFTKKIKIGNIEVPETFSTYGFAGAWNKFGVAVWRNPTLVGHTGGTTGASALFLISPNNQYTIIILSNTTSGTLFLYQKFRDAFGFKGKIENF